MDTTVCIGRDEAVNETGQQGAAQRFAVHHAAPRRAKRTGWVVVGRIGIDDVEPVVSGGRYPAKAVVGEVVPVRATVWREGHYAVAATLVVRYHGTAYPQLVDDPARPAAPEPVPIEDVISPAARLKPQLITMSPGRTPDVFHGQFVPDSVVCGRSGWTAGAIRSPRGGAG